MTWAFLERDSQSYEMDFRLFIEGAEVTDWVQDNIGLTWAGTGAMNTLSFTLANPDDVWTLTEQNIAGEFRKSRNLYSEEIKQTIYHYKKQREDQAKETIKAQDKKIALTEAGIYGLGPEQGIFHKHDCVRLFVRHPLTRKDWWMFGFTGFIDSHPFSDDYITGSVPLNITCYDIKGLMKRMRVAVNPISPAGLSATAKDVQSATVTARDQLKKSEILGPEAGIFEDLFSAKGLNHVLAGKSLQQALYFLFLGEGGIGGGSVGQGRIELSLFGGLRKTDIEEGDDPQTEPDKISPKEQEILTDLNKLNQRPEVIKAGGFDLQGNYNSSTTAKQYTDLLATAQEKDRLRKYQKEAQALGRAYEDAERRRKEAQRRKKAEKAKVRAKITDPRFSLSTFAFRRGHVGRMSKGLIYKYPGDNLEKWYNLTLLGDESGAYLTNKQVTQLGKGTILDPVRGSPFNANLHMLLPADGIAAKTFNQVDFQVNDFTQGVSFKTRYDLVNDICEQIDFQWYVTPPGDVAVEFPTFDFTPKAFGAYQSVLTVDKHAISASIEDEAADIPTAMVVTAQETTNVAQEAAQAPAQSLDINRTVVYAPLLATRLGAVVEQISAPVSVGGAFKSQYGGGGTSGAENWALLQLQKRLGQSSTVSMPAPFRPWILPNRPLYHKQRERLGVIQSVQHSITVNGACQTTPVLQYIKKLHSDGKFRYMSSQGENMPINYATIFTASGDVSTKSGIQIRKGVTEGGSSRPISGDIPTTDQRRQKVGADMLHRFRYPVIEIPRSIPKGYRFGAPRPYRNGIHNGTDFGKLNDAVVAIEKGTVVFAGMLRGYGGIAVYINHSGGWQSIYMHLQEELMVRRGESVSKKQPIGVVGTTGIKRSRPHVHFEIRNRRIPYDPLLILDPEEGKPEIGPDPPGPVKPFIWPTQPAHSIRSYQKFGARNGRHKGLDFGTISNPVVAAAPGTVRWTGDMRAGGYAIWITHGAGYETRYLHLAPGSFRVGRGETVTQGQQIASVGYSGLELAYSPLSRARAASHLHFEILLNGKQIDPEPLLNQEASGYDPYSEEGPRDNLAKR